MELQQMLYLLVADAAVLRRAQDIGYAVERWSGLLLLWQVQGVWVTYSPVTPER
jgi:hypothetical protein